MNNIITTNITNTGTCVCCPQFENCLYTMFVAFGIIIILSVTWWYKEGRFKYE